MTRDEAGLQAWEIRLLLDDANRHLAIIGENFNTMAHILRRTEPIFDVVQSWPVYMDEYGGVMCGKDGCSCDAEDSIIFTPYEDTEEEFPRFNLKELAYWVQEHIEQDTARKVEKLEEEEG